MINTLRYLKKIVEIYHARPYLSVFLPYQRSNEDLSDDDHYVASAVDQVKGLQAYTMISSETSILDFGCGQGQLAIGLLLEHPQLGTYAGIDTDKVSIQWCNRWIHRYHYNYTFIHVEAHNDRYNPRASGRPELPVEPSYFDISLANSVFTHMLGDDVRFYLKQLNKALKIGGIIYLTVFVEEGVPAEEENPPGYLNKTSTLPLHRVRYEKDYLFKMLTGSGFQIIDYKYQGISRTKQSELVAEKTSDWKIS